MLLGRLSCASQNHSLALLMQGVMPMLVVTEVSVGPVIYISHVAVVIVLSVRMPTIALPSADCGPSQSW